MPFYGIIYIENGSDFVILKDKKMSESKINLETENIKVSFAMEGMILDEDITLAEALEEVFIKGL